jgi:hypothetical protein
MDVTSNATHSSTQRCAAAVALALVTAVAALIWWVTPGPEDSVTPGGHPDQEKGPRSMGAGVVSVPLELTPAAGRLPWCPGPAPA